MKDLYLPAGELAAAKERSRDLPSWDLSPAQAADVELLLGGAFAPVDGFMAESECRSVIERKSWRDHFWPLPVFLDVTEQFAADVDAGDSIALRDQEGMLVAFMTVTDKFLSTLVAGHAGERELNPVCISGPLQGIEAPVHHDFKRLRLGPKALRARFDQLGWQKVLGFATRRPLHQLEVNETYNAARSIEANLLLNPAVGAVSPEDRYHYARVHCYEHVVQRYPLHTSDLTLTPIVARGAGLDDALLHAIVLRNLGCTHYMIDRDYVPASETGLDYEQTQEALAAYNDKVGIELVNTDEMIYAAGRGGYVPRSDIATAEQVRELSTAQLIERLKAGLEVPGWFSYREVIDELRKVYRPHAEQGITVFFTGLSGSGKSSIAHALLVKLMEMGERPITLLDGDIVRQNLSSELGFSKEDRDTNIRRIGYVASEITKHGGVAICAPIAPYAATRRHVRKMIEAVGGFVEVYISTPIEVCEARDRKGLYAKARAGIIEEFTGISDPYEEPENPELIIDTEGITPEEGAQRVILTLEKLGYIKLM